MCSAARWLAASGEQCGVVSFKDCERSIEHFPTRHDHDIEAANILTSPEQLAGTAFRPVALDSRAQLARGSHTKSRSRCPIWHDEHRHEPAVDLGARAVDSFKLGTAAYPVRRRQALFLH
jgi:hypothetical protein